MHNNNNNNNNCVICVYAGILFELCMTIKKSVSILAVHSIWIFGTYQKGHLAKIASVSKICQSYVWVHSATSVGEYTTLKAVCAIVAAFPIATSRLLRYHWPEIVWVLVSESHSECRENEAICVYVDWCQKGH